MKLSETMKHSTLATELYVRKIQPLLVENMIKIDERKLVYEEPEMIQTRSRVLEKRKYESKAWKFIIRALDKFGRATFAAKVGDVPIAGWYVFGDAKVVREV